MAAVEVTITGMLYDKLARTTQNVVLVGEASLTGLGIGGGPVIPPGRPPGSGGPGAPVDPGWGYPERPVDPGYGIPGPPYPGRPPSDAHPSHPIALPGDPWWPPDAPQPPQLPPPGSPPVILPGTTPTQPITPPPAIVVDYPGVGKVLVPQPVSG